MGGAGEIASGTVLLISFRHRDRVHSSKASSVLKIEAGGWNRSKDKIQAHKRLLRLQRWLWDKDSAWIVRTPQK